MIEVFDALTIRNVVWLAGIAFFLMCCSYMLCGPMESPLYKYFGWNKPLTEISGYVAPGYESVKLYI